MPVTKHNWLITDAQDIPRIVREAFHVATTGRPGPVLVDIPKDIANQTMDWEWPDSVDLPGYKPNVKGHPKQIKEAARLISESERPVIYAGGGILKARAAEALRELAELTDIPVVTTLMARGAFPDDHELALGMPGMHGNYTAVTSMQKADLLIALGARFDDRVTGKVGAFAPDAKIIHVDVDPAERGGDPRALERGGLAAPRAADGRPADDRAPRRPREPRQTAGASKPLRATRGRCAQAAVRDREAAREHARRRHPRVGCRPAPDVGEPALALRASLHVGELGRARHDGLLGPGRDRRQGRLPGETVWAVDGDGCFQMTAQELVTAAAEKSVKMRS
jgi:acetolactate synthase-1/2/3 large subunit